MAERVDRAGVERILRRALEIDADRPAVDDGGLRLQDLEAVASEVGVSPEAVRLAYAEERLRAGVGVGQHPVLDRIAGPGVVRTTRLVPAPVPVVLERIDDWARHEHTLRLLRREPGAGEWVRSSGIGVAAVRAVRSVQGGATLAKLRSLVAIAAPVDERTTLVLVAADLRGERAWATAGGAGVAGASAAGLGALAVVASPLVLVALPVAAGAGVAVASTHRRAVSRTLRELDALLDAVAAQRTPARLTDAARAVARRVSRPR
jgi:hypothetical protein